MSSSSPFPRNQKITQNHSCLPNDDETENEQQDAVDTPFIVRVVDPTESSPSVWLTRFIIFSLYIVIGIFANAPYTFANTNYAMGFGAFASFVIVACLISVESLLIVPWWYGKDPVGMPCVHWFSYHVTLDSVYHFLNPPHAADIRKVFAGNIGDVHTESIQAIPGDDKDAGDFWFDFVADVGDGFNGTYAVFSTMAQKSLSLYGGQVILPRAHAVIVGGDIAYPWPRKEIMAARFLRPVGWSFPPGSTLQHPPTMYIMPGNHEYADGLKNFNEVILQRKNRMIGNWNLKNTQPYFAIRLPHRWVVFCVDPGNEACQDMDEDQVAYFKSYVTTQTTKDDRFIMCVHEPDWIKNGSAGHGFTLFKRMALFRKDVLGSRLVISLGGDLHYYRRHEAQEGVSTQVQDNPFPAYETTRRQLVVAGHGGAFAHPTYCPTISTIRLGDPHVANAPEYRKITDYPDPQTSRASFYGGFLSAYSWGKNYGMGVILGIFYLQLFLAVTPSDYTTTSPETHGVATGFIQTFWNPMFLQRAVSSFFFWMTLIHFFIHNVIVTTSGMAMDPLINKIRGITLVVMHTAMHVVFAMLLRTLADSVWATALGNSNLAQDARQDNVIAMFWYTAIFCMLSNCAMYAGGYWLGTTVEAIFMGLAIGSGGQYNEPFAGLEIQDWKGFLRIRLRQDGDLELWNLGIDKTPRKWVQRDENDDFGNNPSVFAPDNCRIEVKVVEKVLVKRIDV